MTTFPKRGNFIQRLMCIFSARWQSLRACTDLICLSVIEDKNSKHQTAMVPMVVSGFTVFSGFLCSSPACFSLHVLPASASLLLPFPHSFPAYQLLSGSSLCSPQSLTWASLPMSPPVPHPHTGEVSLEGFLPITRLTLRKGVFLTQITMFPWK